MTTFTTISFKCPICGSRFTSHQASSYGYVGKRSDFRPNYWGFNPSLYSYHLCPDCGYCAGMKDFFKKIDDPDCIKKIKSLGQINKPSLEQKLKQGLQCTEFLKEFGILKLNEYDMANKWLEVFWWAESPDTTEESAMKVLSYYQQAIEKNLIPENEINNIKYLMGEINRRIGQTVLAKKFFNEVIALSEGKEALKGLRNLAIRQKTKPVDNM